MKKVLQYVPSYNYGGIESFLQGIESKLNGLYEFTYVIEQDINQDVKKDLSQYGAKVIRIPNLTKENPIKHILAIRNIFKTEKFDIVHVHGCDLRVFILLYAKLYKVKTRIYHIHSKRIESHSKIKKLFMKINIALSNVIFACSQEAKNCMLKKSKRNVIIVKNGIDTEKYCFNNQKRLEYRKKLNIDKDTVVIGNVGRIVEVKNQKFLLDVLETYLNKGKKAKLIIVGDGELIGELKYIAKKKGIEENVLFLGKRKDTNELYSIFDVFCLSSLAEGFPIVLLEAQCNGLKCIVSNNVPREINITGDVVFLGIESKDVIKWEQQLAIRKINNYNIKRVKNAGYDLKDSTKQIIEIYS